MPCRWREWLVTASVLISPSCLAAQTPELGVGATGTLSDPALAVASGYAGLRTSGRTRITASLGAGVSSQEFAWRGELLGHFLLSPEERRKPGFYVAGGVAMVDGPVRRGYLVLTLGVENRPRARSGWAIEAGVGGGFRVALGYRWRWFPRRIETQ